jgi:hypothetical protein
VIPSQMIPLNVLLLYVNFWAICCKNEFRYDGQAY